MWKVFEHGPFCFFLTSENIRTAAPLMVFECVESIRTRPLFLLTKLPSASLNLSTYIALYTYGYRNIYELAPQVDLERSALPFESTSWSANSGSEQ